LYDAMFSLLCWFLYSVFYFLFLQVPFFPPTGTLDHRFNPPKEGQLVMVIGVVSTVLACFILLFFIVYRYPFSLTFLVGTGAYRVVFFYFFSYFFFSLLVPVGGRHFWYLYLATALL